MCSPMPDIDPEDVPQGPEVCKRFPDCGDGCTWPMCGERPKREARVFVLAPAHRLLLGDRIVKVGDLGDAAENGWDWRLLSHDLTARGDYASVVECDGSDWTERFDPEETVWRLVAVRSGPERPGAVGSGP
jgi:hypothetical protein